MRLDFTRIMMLSKILKTVLVATVVTAGAAVPAFAQSKKADPYTDGARVGKPDPYTDGARTVAGLDRSGVSAQPSRSFDPYTDGARVGKADPYTDGAIA